MATTMTLAILAHPVHTLLAAVLLAHGIYAAARAVRRALEVDADIATVRWAA